MDVINPLEFGIAGGLTIVLVGMILAFVTKVMKNRQEAKYPTNGALSMNGALPHIKGIHQVVAAVDEDGTPKVYVPRSLTSAIRDLADATREQTRMMERMGVQMDEVRSDVRELIRHQ